MEEPMNLGKIVIPSEIEAEIEREEVRLRISGGEMKGITEAPFLEELDKLSDLPPSRCIYRVPERLRQENENKYTPQVVSIGPLHHGNGHLEAMEEHKKRYLRDFLSRPGVCFCDCIQIIKKKEKDLRDFYAKSIVLESDKFVKVVLVDAAFVIELLMRDRYTELQDPDDYIFKNPRMLWDVRPDLQLLENQLPFFILRDLFNTLSASSQLHSLLEISYHFFEKGIHGGGKENFVTRCSSGEVQHFVDLIRILYGPLDQEKKPKTTATPETIDIMTATPNVTELHQAGVKFKVRKGSSLFDIKFECGILEIPKLTVNDTTDLTLRNLLAFEQCHHREEGYLANYVFLMKRLVKTPEDVQLLVKKRIIANWLGDTKKISTLLHDLGTGMIVDHHYYATLCKDLTDYRKNLWHQWMVNLKQNYFNTPWASISVGAAGTLLILTVIITVCSIKSVQLSTASLSFSRGSAGRRILRSIA